MSYSPHPDAAITLALIGQHHPDKRIAKAARRSAYRAASRPGGPTVQSLPPPATCGIRENGKALDAAAHPARRAPSPASSVIRLAGRSARRLPANFAASAARKRMATAADD